MDFVGKRRYFFLASLIIIAAGILSMLIPGGFRIGIEFTGGSALTVTFDGVVAQEKVRSVVTGRGHDEAVIQRLGEDSFLIRTRTLKEALGAEESERQGLENALRQLAPIVNSDMDAVSPLIAEETVRNAFLAVLVAAVGILLYITWAFRAMPNSFRMGTTAILATVHDILVVLGIFSTLGRIPALNLEVNVMFITGVLTVLGYSVHDTIVVFDRIRENTARRTGRGLEATINISIMETMGRSLTTSITTLLVITAMLLLGGATLQSLLVTLFIGVVTGTYSSIAIASQLLVVWERGEWLGLLRRLRGSAGTPTQAS
jgi:preprotein translocase subunit SecF